MYRIQIQDFEGPLDLLLFFIRRDEIDVHDIPIAHIADEFLGYVRVMEQIDLDGVADFIYMAALLISIKVRMLLPRPEVDDEGEPLDPRRELVERLLEYMRYKEAAQGLAAYHEQRGDLFTRGAASAVHPDAAWEREPEEILNASLFNLIGALRRVLTEADADEPHHAVAAVEYDVATQRAFVLDRLGREGPLTFVALARHRHKGFVIATFLAVLELARQGAVHLARTPDASDFIVAPAEPPASAPGRVNGHVNGTTAS
ncbi:MAG: segregation/condensation protein A [Rhodothermales bacterium]|nr:segregation/condensation protein A [Rhodothermales bacterium]